MHRTMQVTSAPTDRTGVEADFLTIAGIGVIAYIFANVLHEGVGHGGACLISGGRALVVSTVHVECSVDSQLLKAGGTLVNIAAGVVFFLLARWTHQRLPRLKYFFWLAAAVNLFSAAGYFAFSGIIGFGDWALFIEGFAAQWAWRIGLSLFGAAAYMLVGRISLLEMRALIGTDPQQRYAHAVRLSKTPYFSGGIVACLAGLLNPSSIVLVVTSAAAWTFGGTSGLLWTMDWLNRGWIPPGAVAEPLPIRRSWFWIGAAFILAIAFIALLGPGLRLSAAAPAR